MADFVSRTGAGIGDVFSNFQIWMTRNSATIIIVMLVIIVIMIIINMSQVASINGKKAETLYCNPGNRSPLCKQTRETLASSVLATGYDADPAAFCANVGEETNDPWGYLMHTASDPAGMSESLSRHATHDERMDRALAIAMHH